MARTDPARSNPKRKRKLASQGTAARGIGPRKRVVPPAEETPAAAPPVGRLERTRRLILAALRVWELKRKIRD